MTKQTTSVTTAPQGIMTDEVGAITGDVEITTEASGSSTLVKVAYLGAKDTYTVTGSPVSAELAHSDVVAKLTSAGPEANAL